MSLIHQREDLKTYRKKHIDLKNLSYYPFIQIFWYDVWSSKTASRRCKKSINHDRKNTINPCALRLKKKLKWKQKKQKKQI
jgi:hypothetical protein